MFKGFKDFIAQGNVIDLAVAVVIGAAFGAIVTAIVDAVINPLLGAFLPSGDLATWTIAYAEQGTELGEVQAAIDRSSAALADFFRAAGFKLPKSVWRKMSAACSAVRLVVDIASRSFFRQNVCRSPALLRKAAIASSVRLLSALQKALKVSADWNCVSIDS